MVSEEGVYQKVKEALLAFFQEDHELLHLDANERSISHKLAEHIQKQFPRLKVDCEYNRHGESVKTLLYSDIQIRPDDLEAKTVFPDIVLHKRGTDAENYLVIEIKKKNSGTIGYANDFKKLKGFTKSEYEYRVGLFLMFDVNKKIVADVRCFQNGKEVQNTEWAGLRGLGHG